MRKSDIEETCNTRLELGLGVGENYYGATSAEVYSPEKKQPLICFDPTAATAQEDLDNARSLNDDKNNNNNKGCNKKLKLTKDQATVLENSFNSNNILNTAHKQALAEQLNLKQRQIEVWFQNRRARTKLKQTEDEHEMLRRRCEILTNENRKLRDELRNLRSLIKFEPFDHGLVPLPYPNPTNQIALQMKDYDNFKN